SHASGHDRQDRSGRDGEMRRCGRGHGVRRRRPAAAAGKLTLMRTLEERAKRVVVSAAVAVAAAAGGASAQRAKSPAPSDVVATVGTTTITLAQVDDVALQQRSGNFGNIKLSQALYQARRNALDEMVGDSLIRQEAAARGVTSDALATQEISSKVTA